MKAATAPAAKASAKKSKAKRAPGKWKRRIQRTLIGFAIGLPLSILLLWYGIHHTTWLGPWLADAARAVLGPERVTKIEEKAYKVEDRYNRWSRKGEAPQAHWDVPAADSASDPDPEPPPAATDGGALAANAFDAATDGASVASPPPPSSRPARVGPLYADVAAKGDGAWVAVTEPGAPKGKDPPAMWKTLIHVDQKRPWAELFVVAMDARRVKISLVAGTKEPIASTREGWAYSRKGLVPERDRDDLAAAFNGGFKAEHGQLGMSVGGVTLLPPKKNSCTVAAYKDDDVLLRIGTWSKIADTEKQMAWWRQGPSCMVEDGKLHPGLENEETMSWGSAVGGDTVIRRSALGLSKDGKTLYMGISNYTTARAIALGMKHVGADDVVQLDVNWSYPHFVTFRRAPSGQRDGVLLFDGFVFHKGEYTQNPSTRDFFYVTRRTAAK